jgi:uncharacterized protein
MSATADLAMRLERVCAALAQAGPVLVAYSGGVDSSVLLALAARTPGAGALGVIADSPSLPRAALAQALRRAAEFGARVEVLHTQEFENPAYAANGVDRCFYCKSELFGRMEALAQARGFDSLAYGENADDPPALRPGSRAASAFRVRAPLRDEGLGKEAVREAARLLGLDAADEPAQPCLSSRVSTGLPVTREVVGLVERGEGALRGLGLRVLRVRVVGLDPPDAWVQVAPDELPMLRSVWTRAVEALMAAGFARAGYDPAGYQGAGLR